MRSKITLSTTAIATRYSTRYSDFYYYSTQTRLEVKNHYSLDPANDTSDLKYRTKKIVTKFVDLSTEFASPDQFLYPPSTIQKAFWFKQP